MRRGSAGFTLLELMTVVTVMAILVAIAIPGFGYLSASTKVKAASTELYLAMTRARAEAVKRNRAVAIVKTGAEWQAGWQIVSDTNNDGSFADIGDDDDDDRLLSTQGELKRVTITLAETCGAPPCTMVVFRPSGRIADNVSDGASPPAFDLTSEDQDRSVDLKRCVTAQITGKPYIRQEACPV